MSPSAEMGGEQRLLNSLGSRSLSLVLPLLLLSLVSVPNPASGLRMCVNKNKPFPPAQTLSFCPQYGNLSCCTAAQDGSKESDFRTMNIPTDSPCFEITKKILCSECDPYAAHLYGLMGKKDPSVQRTFPFLCSNPTPDLPTTAFCRQVYESCADVPFPLNPFVNGQVYDPVMLSQIYPDADSFCVQNDPSVPIQSNNPHVCYDGEPITIPRLKAREEANRGENVPAPLPAHGMCVERISTKMPNRLYVALVSHPDGGNRAFLVSQYGQIFLVTLPREGQELREARRPFLDIANRISDGYEMGLLGLAFHPEFKDNGRFFVSYTCDSTKDPTCAMSAGVKCACNRIVGCDVRTIKLGRYGEQPCRNASVISEYSVYPDTPSSSDFSPLSATVANPREIRRIFALGQPFANRKGGQIRFSPKDKYLYYMLGDGGGDGDPYNFAQNIRSPLGKILRLDVDGFPSQEQILAQNLYGSYGIPPDNPFAGHLRTRPEIWALGLRNPWKCTFDREKPDYMYCGDPGEEGTEEINLITRKGNFGWRLYEGNQPFTAREGSFNNEYKNSIPVIGPSMQFPHRPNEYSAVIGGYVSRSKKDPCLYGRYLFNDFAGYMFVGTEKPYNSGLYDRNRLVTVCAPDSIVPCEQNSKYRHPLYEYTTAWGQDNNQSIYVVAANGLYRLIEPGRCSLSCAQSIPESINPLLMTTVYPPVAPFGGPTDVGPTNTGVPSSPSDTGGTQPTAPPSVPGTTDSTPSTPTDSGNTNTNANSNDNSDSSAKQGGGGGGGGGADSVNDQLSANHPQGYWIKLAAILGTIFAILLALQVYCCYAGWKEGQERAKIFEELQMGDTAPIYNPGVEGNSDMYGAENLYGDGGSVFDGGDGGSIVGGPTGTRPADYDYYDDDRFTNTDTMTDVDGYDQNRMYSQGRVGYAESEADSEYTTHSGGMGDGSSSYLGAGGRLPGGPTDGAESISQYGADDRQSAYMLERRSEVMSDRQSEYTDGGGGEWAEHETQSFYGR